MRKLHTYLAPGCNVAVTFWEKDRMRSESSALRLAGHGAKRLRHRSPPPPVPTQDYAGQREPCVSAKDGGRIHLCMHVAAPAKPGPQREGTHANGLRGASALLLHGAVRRHIEHDHRHHHEHGATCKRYPGIAGEAGNHIAREADQGHDRCVGKLCGNVA